MEFGIGITPEVVSSRLVKRQLKIGSPNAVAKLLRDLGYKLHPHRVRVGDEVHTLWYKDVYQNKATRLFKASLNIT